MRLYDPIYKLPLSARGVLLARDNVKIVAGKKVVRGKAEVRFSFLPDLRLRIKIGHLQGDLLCLMNAPTVKIVFSSGHRPVDAILTKVNLRRTNSFVEAIQSRDFVLIGGPRSVARIAFLLFNFVEFRSDYHPLDQGRLYRTVVLETDEWGIQLNQRPDVHERLERLKGTGGFTVTHVGSIERVDNKLITAKTAEKIERGLGLFLSFARGFFCHPALSCGIASTGKKIWQKWNNPLVERHRSVFSWFDAYHPKSLSTVFPGFWRKWNEDTWTSTLSTVIYWYCRSNPALSGTDGSLILAQTGLERLAWTYLVESKKSLSNDGFGKLTAADQIRLLLSQCGIPLGVPANLSTLSTYSRRYNLDGPGAITKVRNGIVHPKPKRAPDESTAIVDTWRLSLWYFELALLSLFGYSGEYSNRLRHQSVGEVEIVPWAT